MNNVHSKYVKAYELLEEFGHGDEKIITRLTALLNNIEDFIEKIGFSEKVVVNELSLGYMLLDYFEDIRRLKLFHNIEHVNSVKIVAYTSYWFLVRKPIQVIEREREYVYINERFVLAYILDFLSGNDEVPILLRKNEGLKSFSELLFYFLKYRFHDANSLEMMLTAFFAGQIYQEKGTDISRQLGKYVED